MARQGGTTRKQRELLAFITDSIKETGVAPSFDEMREAVGLASKSGVHRLVHALAERGHIEFMPNRARAVFLPGGSDAAKDPAVCGIVIDALDDAIQAFGPINAHNSGVAGTRIAARLARLGLVQGATA